MTTYPELNLSPTELDDQARWEGITPQEAAATLTKLVRMHQAYVSRRVARRLPTATDLSIIEALPALGMAIVALVGSPQARPSYPHLRLGPPVATGQIYVTNTAPASPRHFRQSYPPDDVQPGDIWEDTSQVTQTRHDPALVTPQEVEVQSAIPCPRKHKDDQGMLYHVINETYFCTHCGGLFSGAAIMALLAEKETKARRKRKEPSSDEK